MTDPLIEPASPEDVAEQEQDVWEEEPEQIVLPDDERPVPLDEPES